VRVKKASGRWCDNRRCQGQSLTIRLVTALTVRAVGNVAAVLRSYEAFARGDLDGVVADMDPEIEWHQAQGLPHGGVYRGLDEVRRAIFDPLDEEWWDDFRAEPEQLLDAGDSVVVHGRYTGRAKETGNSLDVPFAHVWSFRDGKAVLFRQFLDTAGWIEALSL
jgi:ketosteroid isomerase-like protein